MDDRLLTGLVADLASPDPDVRDDKAYPALARAVAEGRLTSGQRGALAASMLERLGHERVEARTFAPLVLAALVRAGHGEAAWVGPVAAWYVGEQDLRGYDARLGWLHAVAHGADFFGACGRAGVGAPADLLAALVGRLVAATDAVWRDQEDDRVACALALVLAHPDLEAEPAVRWLDPVRAFFAGGEPGPVPPAASNAMRTLRSLHVALGASVVDGDEPVHVPHAATVRRELDDVLAVVTPWFWRPS